MLSQTRKTTPQAKLIGAWERHDGMYAIFRTRTEYEDIPPETPGEANKRTEVILKMIADTAESMLPL